MSAADVRLTLENEIKLLEGMIDYTKNFEREEFTGAGKYIASSWERFLGDRRDTNLELLKLDDSELVSDLEEERDQVEKYVDTTARSPAYHEAWEKFLVCERDILDRLIAKAKESAR